MDYAPKGTRGGEMPSKKDKPKRKTRSKKKDSEIETLRSAMIMLSREDIEWLDELVAHLKRSRRKTSKSEVIRLAINRLRKMKEAEILEELRFME